MAPHSRAGGLGFARPRIPALIQPNLISHCHVHLRLIQPFTVALKLVAMRLTPDLIEAVAAVIEGEVVAAGLAIRTVRSPIDNL